MLPTLQPRGDVLLHEKASVLLQRIRVGEPQTMLLHVVLCLRYMCRGLGGQASFPTFALLDAAWDCRRSGTVASTCRRE